MLDATVISAAIAGAKNLFDIIDKIYSKVGSEPKDGMPDELRNDLLGSEGLSREKSAEISQMIGARTYPFLLRMGRTFNLPADFRRMEEAVLAKDVWDWTYCFDSKHISPETLDHLKALFCDAERPQLLKRDVATTTLALSSEAMPQLFGETLYIAGVVLANVGYEHIYSIPEKFILPTVVVKYDSGSTVGYSNPIAMNFFLRKALDFLYTISINRQYLGDICIDDIPGDDKRSIPYELLGGLRIRPLQ